MFFLYGILSTSVVGFLTYRVIKYLYFPKLKSFDNDFKENDTYILFCYRIKYENGDEEVYGNEITIGDLEEFNEVKKIKYIIIDYMYNNKFMRYITYNMNIDFPIYDVDVSLSSPREIISEILLNKDDITTYIKPFLGPKENFYKDKNIVMNLKDLLEEHPEFDKLNFDEGEIIIRSESNKTIVYDLPWKPVWKPFSGNFDKSSDITYYIRDNADNPFGFINLPDDYK